MLYANPLSCSWCSPALSVCLFLYPNVPFKDNNYIGLGSILNGFISTGLYLQRPYLQIKSHSEVSFLGGTSKPTRGFWKEFLTCNDKYQAIQKKNNNVTDLGYNPETRRFLTKQLAERLVLVSEELKRKYGKRLDVLRATLMGKVQNCIAYITAC